MCTQSLPAVMCRTHDLDDQYRRPPHTARTCLLTIPHAAVIRAVQTLTALQNDTVSEFSLISVYVNREHLQSHRLFSTHSAMTGSGCELHGSSPVLRRQRTEEPNTVPRQRFRNLNSKYSLNSRLVIKQPTFLDPLSRTSVSHTSAARLHAFPRNPRSLAVQST